MAGGAGSRFVEITLEEIEKFLRRGFRVLRPREVQIKGSEIAYDLSLSKFVIIRIQTSIARGRDVGRGLGQDTIKVRLMSKKGSPLLPGRVKSTEPGKAAVKRTKNWKATLQKRIEEAVELYEDKENYWDSRAGARDQDLPDEDQASNNTGQPEERQEPKPKPAPKQPAWRSDPPTDKQLWLIGKLLNSLDEDQWVANNMERRFKLAWPPTTDSLQEALDKGKASTFIDILKSEVGAVFTHRGRFATEDDAYRYDRTNGN